MWLGWLQAQRRSTSLMGQSNRYQVRRLQTLTDVLIYLYLIALVRRLKPYFEPPEAEDANSPVGPLQHSVAELDFAEWENIDWAALSMGIETTNGCGMANSQFVALDSDVTPQDGASKDLYTSQSGQEHSCESKSTIVSNDIFLNIQTDRMEISQGMQLNCRFLFG